MPTSFTKVSTPGTNQEWTSVAYAPAASGLGSGQGRLCACAFFNNGAGSDTHLFMTSDDLGATWTLQNGVTISDGFSDITWDPTHSLFIACRGVTTGASVNQILTSPDGVTWTLRAVTSTHRTQDALTYHVNLAGSGITRIVVVGQDATVAPPEKLMLWSDDGTSYTETFNSPGTFLYVVATNPGFGGSFKYMALPSGANPAVWVSGDGVSWGTASSPFASSTSITNNGPRLLAYSPTLGTLGRAVAIMKPTVGGSSTLEAWTTDDGINWTHRANFTTAFSTCGGIVWNPDGGFFFGIGGTYGSGLGTYHVIVSRDGITWFECSMTGVTVTASENPRTPVYCLTSGSTGLARFVIVEFDAGHLGHSAIYADIALPTITSITANSGPTSGGQLVTVKGTHFDSTTKVKIDGNDCTAVTLIDQTTLTAITPSGTVGAKDVVVYDACFNDTLVAGYTYVLGTIGAPVSIPQGTSTGGVGCRPSIPQATSTGGSGCRPGKLP